MRECEYELVGDLAIRLAVDKSSLFKWLKGNGFGDWMFDVRTKATRGQAAKAVTLNMAHKIVAERRKQGWEC